MSDRFDTILLASMPVATGLKTLMFLLLTIVQMRYPPVTPLGFKIRRLFASLIFTSLLFTILFTVFVIKWHNVELSDWIWIMLPLDIVVVITAYMGWDLHKESGESEHRVQEIGEQQI